MNALREYVTGLRKAVHGHVALRAQHLDEATWENIAKVLGETLR